MPRVNAYAKPRGRICPYAFFVQTCREDHKKKHPDEQVTFTEFSRKCAAMWNAMFDHEKKRFYEMADEDKKRYAMEMQDYIPPNCDNGRVTKRKRTKDPNAPRRPLTAFMWFCNDQRRKIKAMYPAFGVVDIAKELGRRWPYVDPELRSHYEEMAVKDRARYDREMAAYRRTEATTKKQESEDEEEE